MFGRQSRNTTPTYASSLSPQDEALLRMKVNQLEAENHDLNVRYQIMERVRLSQKHELRMLNRVIARKTRGIAKLRQKLAAFDPKYARYAEKGAVVASYDGPRVAQAGATGRRGAPL